MAVLGYVFWCTPCQTRHAGECPPKKSYTQGYVIEPRDWDGMLASMTPQPKDTTTQWKVGDILATCPPDLMDKMIMRVTKVYADGADLETIAGWGSWWNSIAQGRAGFKTSFHRQSYYGIYSKVIP